MNAYNVNILKNKQGMRYVELTAYALLAIGLIGHLFAIDTQIAIYNVALLTIGTVFGMMAVMNWTPMNETLNRSKALEPGDVLPFKINNNSKATSQDKDRHAA